MNFLLHLIHPDYQAALRLHSSEYQRHCTFSFVIHRILNWKCCPLVLHISSYQDRSPGGRRGDYCICTTAKWDREFPENLKKSYNRIQNYQALPFSRYPIDNVKRQGRNLLFPEAGEVTATTTTGQMKQN